jgi:hypothetical protein
MLRGEGKYLLPNGEDSYDYGRLKKRRSWDICRNIWVLSLCGMGNGEVYKKGASRGIDVLLYCTTTYFHAKTQK